MRSVTGKVNQFLWIRIQVEQQTPCPRSRYSRHPGVSLRLFAVVDAYDTRSSRRPWQGRLREPPLNPKRTVHPIPPDTPRGGRPT